MGQWVNPTDQCDPSNFGDSLTLDPLTHYQLWYPVRDLSVKTDTVSPSGIETSKSSLIETKTETSPSEESRKL
jgi:hypothetical protein